MFVDALSLLFFYADHKGALYTCIYDYIQFYVYLCNVHSMYFTSERGFFFIYFDKVKCKYNYKILSQQIRNICL